MEKARGMKAGKERTNIYQKAERVVMDDAPWIPVYYYTRISLMKSFVKGYKMTAMGPLSLEKVWLNK